MLAKEEAIKNYNKESKQRERKFEKVLLKFYAWQQYPGESWTSFKKRFRSVKILIDIESLPVEQREDILRMINQQYPR